MSNEDTLRALGKLITKPAERDAVHIAVTPVTAAILLTPGMHVGILLDGKASPKAVKPVGIVDPFLKTSVAPGEQFFLFLYPGSITSLHHHWTHPSFPTMSEEDLRKGAAREWVEQWAQSIDLDGGADEVLEIAKNYLRHGDYHVDGGKFEGVDVPNTFWDKYELLTGTTVSESSRGTFFSCSC